MHVSRLRVLCIEIFKTLKHLNPPFMSDIFKIKSSRYSSRNPYDLQHHRPNQVTFGSNSLRSLGPQIWNALPNEIKSTNNLNSFKRLIKQWDGPNCRHTGKPGPRTLRQDPGPRTQDLGPRTQDPGPRTQDLGPRT